MCLQKFSVRVGLFAAIALVLCPTAYGQLGGGGRGPLNSVDVTDLEFNASGLTNGVGDLQATADYFASRALNSSDSTVTSTLDITATDDDTSYFSTEYEFTISAGQTATWTLDSPTCNTVTSGEYKALPLVTGCGTFSFDDALELLFD